jgi:DNA ligase (NAD+)
LIVVSGIFEKYSRDELKKLIEINGGKVSSSISKNTSFILAGSNMGPSKKQKAEALDIKIIKEEEFIKIIYTT